MLRNHLSALVCIMTLGSGAMHAETTTVKPIEERPFLLYLLKNEFDRDVQRIISQGRPAGYRIAGLIEAEARFLARRDLVYHSIRRQIERRKDLQDLLPIFQQYEKLLKLHKELMTQLRTHQAAFYTKVGIANQAAASQAMMSALVYSLRALAEGDEENAFGRGFFGLIGSSMQGRARVQAVAKQAGEELTAAVDANFKEYLEQREPLRKQFADDFRSFFKEMKDKESWTGTENPFLIVAKARAVLRNTDATVNEMISLAQACRRAAALVPSMPRQSTELDVPRFTRAMFLGIGATIANRAAEKDLGSTGLPLTSRIAPAAGRLAHSLWLAYRKNEPFAKTVDDHVLQEFALGCAYGGGFAAADAVLLPNIVQVVPRFGFRGGVAQLRLAASRRPDFWYDCARIYSVLGNPDLALQCLRAAAQMGFQEKEAAKVCPDLKNVRDNARTAAGFRGLFP